MATHSRILAWEIPWTEDTGGVQPIESQRVGRDLATKQQNIVTHIHYYNIMHGIVTILKILCTPAFSIIPLPLTRDHH